MTSRRTYNIIIFILSIIYFVANTYRRYAIRTGNVGTVATNVTEQAANYGAFNFAQILIVITVIVVLSILLILYCQKISSQSRFSQTRKYQLQRISEFIKKRSENSVRIANDYVDVEYYFSEVMIITSRNKESNSYSQITVKAGFLNSNLDLAFSTICDNFGDKTSFNNIYTIVSSYGLGLTLNQIPVTKIDFEDTENHKNEEIKEEPIGVEQNKKEYQKVEIIEEKIEEETVNAEIQKFDINTASEAEIQKLPGINIVLAKKIIKTRHEKGGFSSIDDFIKTMGIKDHFASKIKKMITVNKINQNTSKKELRGRIVDI